MGERLMILPGTGRWQPEADGGADETRSVLKLGPSTMLRMVPHPVPGRIW